MRPSWFHGADQIQTHSFAYIDILAIEKALGRNL